MRVLKISFLILFIIGCGETEFEKNTRREYSSIIRRVDSNYQTLHDNKQQEESLSMVKARDFYSSYIERFSEIRDDLAGARQAEKFDTVKNKISSILSASNKFLNNRQSTLISAFNATNSYSNYRENLSKLVSYVEDYDRYSSQDILDNRLSTIVQDSVDFHKAYKELEQNINERDSLVSELINLAYSLNQIVNEFQFKDTLKFHKEVIGKENVFTEAWDNIENVSVRPNTNIRDYFGNQPQSVKEPTEFDFSISGEICDNSFSENSIRNDFDWANNYEWKKDEYGLSCKSTNANRGTVNFFYESNDKTFPVEKGTATFSEERINQFTFTILGGRIGIIVKLKELFGEPINRNKYQNYEELEWEIGNTELFLNSRDNYSRLLIQI